MKNVVNKISKFSLEDVRKQKSHTDWNRVHAMSDAEITAASQSDTDSLPLDDDFFAVAQRLSPRQLTKRNNEFI